MSERVENKNPCLSCGACCASYRVSFYWSEAKELGLEGHHIEKVNGWRICMAGTNQRSPLCCSLEGVVGRQVICLVYANRPSPCREVQPGDDKCNKARIRHGLNPIDPADMSSAEAGDEG